MTTNGTTRTAVRWQPSPLMVRISRNVKRHRQARDWTQQRLADRVPTSRIYIAQIEGAAKEISIEMLGRLATALRVSPSKLVS